MAQKYKRRLAVRDIKGLPDLVKGIWTPTVRDWHDVIEDMVSIARCRQNNKFAMFRLQISMFSDILEMEKGIAQYARLLNEPTEARKWVPEPEPIDDFHRDYWDKELTSYKIILSALRDIGDSIAWRVLQYNRPLLYLMTLNSSEGAPQLDAGRISELNELADIVNDPTITHFFLHSVTNLGRIGDITSVDDTGLVEFAEVKSKPNPRGKTWKERVSRQIIRLDNLTKLANEGIGIVDEKGVGVKMIDAVPKTALRQIRAALLEAQASGLASRILQPYLSITVADFSSNQKVGSLNDVNRAAISAIKENGDVIIPFNSPQQFEFSPHRAPLSVYPLEPKVITGLLLGRIMIFYDFNISRFFRELSRHGWNVVDSFLNHRGSYNPNKDPVFMAKKGRLTIAAPPSMIAQVMFEGLSPKSLVQIFEAIYSEGPSSSPSRVIHGFSGERQLWT